MTTAGEANATHAAVQSELRQRLARVLNPRCIAVVGDKQVRNYSWLKSLKPFTGSLYSVQVDEREIPGIEELGVKNFGALADIPEPIDFVVCAAPRAVAPHIVRDCIAVGAGGIALFTSGFSEHGDEQGKQLEQELIQLARDARLPLIGPNCMGLHIPRLGVRFSTDQPVHAGGDIAFISQSGTHGLNFSLGAALHGLYCSTLVSFGNGAVLEAADYLDYFADDDTTEVIGMYIEGVRDGPRFARVLRDVARRKPVVVWKGGQTEVGKRATLSHTASLTTNSRVWNALVKQAGAIPVDSLDEMLDVVKALRRPRPTTGRSVALAAMTGGQSVVIADDFAKAGFEIPIFSAASSARLREFVNVIGGSAENPLDLVNTVLYDATAVRRVLDILNEDPKIDAIAFEVSAYIMHGRWAKDPALLEALLDTVAAFNRASTKTFAVIIYPGHVEAKAADVRDALQQRGVATYPTFARAATALAKAIAFHAAQIEP